MYKRIHYPILSSTFMVSFFYIKHFDPFGIDPGGMHRSNFIFYLDCYPVVFMLFIDKYIFFLYCFEMTLLSYTKFLDVFESISVLPIIFHWSIHRPVPQCWNYWSYINVLISGKSSPFTLLKSFPSYAYFSI